MAKKDGRLCTRHDNRLLGKIKQYADRNNTTVSAIIDSHFRDLLSRESIKVSVHDTGDAEQV